jgi:hypothetical protein
VLVTLKGFGSIWERRFGNDSASQTRFASATFYNTTGVMVSGKVRHRWKISGKIRFKARAGFYPDCPNRSLNKVFECDGPEPLGVGWTQTSFRRALRGPERPDCFLFVVTAEQIGRMDWRSSAWKANDVRVISFSEDRDQQEAMLLMPAYSWVHGELGTFFAEPSPAKFWSAELRMGRAG